MRRALRWSVVLVALVGGGLPLLPRLAEAAPTNFIENDQNVVFDGTGTFDWANNGGLTAPTTNGGVWTRSGSGGIFNGGVFNPLSTAPTRTAASLLNPTIADAAFRVDPLSIDSVPCGPGGAFITGDPTVFTGAGSETNNGPIGTFTYSTGSAPNKNDLANVYALSHVTAGVNEVFFGGERTSTNGDSHIDFEFLQSEITLSSPCGPGVFSGHRTQGDLLLSVDFEQGGTLGGASLHRWQCTSVYNAALDGTVCDPPPNGNPPQKYYSTPSAGIAVFGVNANAPVGCGGWVCRLEDGTTVEEIAVNGLMEGAIDLAAAGFDGCISTFLPHTRSSQSFTAVLKDFVAPIQFSNCKHPTVTTSLSGGGQSGASITVPTSTSVSDQATLNDATADAGGTLTYRVFTDANCTVASTDPVVDDTVTVTNGVVPASPAHTFSQAGTFYWQATYSGDIDTGGRNFGAVSACTAEVLTVQSPNLSITKTADATPVSAGDGIGFSITLTNNGPGTALGTTLSDPLPTGAGVSWSFDPAVAGCSINSNTLSCSFGDLASGESRTVHLISTTTPASCTSYPNTATAAATNHAQITSSATINVQCPDVSVLKTADSGTINAGDTAAFTIVVTSNGPGRADGVTLNDTLPAGVTWSEDSDDCSITNSVLSCSFGDLASGATRTIHVSGTTDADDCGVLSNTATVGATNEPAGADANNSSTATITVQCPDVSVVKTAENSPINAGDTAAFTVVVTSNGPGTAYGVALNDTLPAGVTWSEDSSDCSITNSVLSCSFGDLASGATRTIHVSGATDADDCGQLPNTATVAATNEPSSALGNNSSDAIIAVQCADIQIDKAADAGTVNAGDAIGFTVTVSNVGAGTAYGVVVSDTLPTNGGLSWSIDGGTAAAQCSITTGVLTCQLGDVAPGATPTVHLTSPTTAATCGTVSNTADVTTTNDGSDQDSGTIQVDCPDVTVLKTADDSVISAGDPASFSIVVTNNGPGTAYGVTLSDELPDGIAWTDDSADCAIDADGLLTCDFGDLTAQGTASVTVSGVTDAADCGTLTNTAIVAATNEPDTATGNNDSTDTIDVNCADIEVVKLASDDVIDAGDNAVFIIQVTNIGEGIARDATLDDTLPPGAWTITGGTAALLCSINLGAVHCDFADMAPGDLFTLELTRPTTGSDCGVISNTANVAATNEGADVLGNNSSTASITVLCASIGITKVADASPVNAGEGIGFLLTVTNSGAGTAKGVVLTDTLPTTSGTNWTIDSGLDSDDCSITAGVLTCNFGDVEPNGTRSVHISSPTTAASCGTVDNTGSVTTTNDGSADAPAAIVVNCPNVTVAKTADTGTINAGETAAFTILASNVGAGTATNVTLDDPLPDGIAWSEDSDDCDIVAGTLSCDFGDLASGATRTIHVSGASDAADCGTLPNTATVGADNEPASALGDNTGSATITVNCPDITVLKTADQGTINAGDTAAFTITVSNTGAGTAIGVTLDDTLPSGVTWSEDSDDCNISSGVLSCDFGDLGSGATREVHVSGTTTAVNCGTLSNTALVAAANEAAGATGNNSSTATITVNCPTLDLTKVADATTVVAGNPIGFTLTVTIGGAGTATNVVLTDSLPTNAGLSWTVSPAVNGCSITTAVLTCTFGDLAAGSVRTVHVSSPTTSASCGVLNNTGTVSASNAPNDEASASLTVQCLGGRVTPTATTCQDFQSGTAGDLTTVFYGVKGNKINNVAPGVFFYYSRVTAPTSTFTVLIDQSNNNATINLFGLHQDQTRVYRTDCSPYANATFQVVNGGDIRITVNGAVVGQQFVIGIKFNPGTVVGQTRPTPSTVHYDFATVLGNVVVDGDADGVNLVRK